MPNRDLEGKIAIITGAGSGIGAGIARVLHDRGATLALCDLFGESAEKTAKNLSEIEMRMNWHRKIAGVN